MNEKCSCSDQHIKQTHFEHVVCSRCSGAGFFTCYGHINGGRCFKCGGTGFTFTKRGHAAYVLWIESRKKLVADVEIGDTILIEGVPGFQASFWGKVEKVERGFVSAWRMLEDGTKVPIESVKFTFAGNDKSYSLSNGIKVIVRSKTNEERDGKVTKALEFQESLTKMGKPRKRVASPASSV